MPAYSNIIALFCLATVVYSQRATSSSCVYTMDNVLEKIVKIGIKVEEIEKRLNAIEAQQTGTLQVLKTPKVAFRTQLSSNLGTVSSGSTVKFDQVDLNLGSAYSDGVFTAPYNGTYIFSMVLGNPKGKPGAFFMKKDGVGIQYAIAGHTTSWNIGGVTTVAELVIGDRVWVEGEGNVSGAYPTARYHTGFSGILVNAY
ncbi:uncharacterized protein LOC128559750 [Mercenaria mercenaria]|uniref:uncharacterized protein LOC128559750 n=1 Tax=Mercenaria mercenaria TaxID=6596 RepID=UPI00234F19D9|nr:uncharacterized protein LOC128559750 [Mercenaria mercenaria]